MQRGRFLALLGLAPLSADVFNSMLEENVSPTTFRDEFVPNIEAGPYHSKWQRQQPRDAARWVAFRDAAIAYKKGDTLVPPTMDTPYGKALVAAGKIHMSVTDIGGVWTGSYPTAPPLTINSAGTYGGFNYTSTSAGTPAITVNTPQPVTISNCAVTNLAGGYLINNPGWQVQLTISHVFAYGGMGYLNSGRFVNMENLLSLSVTNCTLENTRGIFCASSPIGASITIQRNKHHNIQGDAFHEPQTHVGNFVQFLTVVNATVDVSWNEIINEYNLSDPEDLVSIYQTSHVHLHDNYFQHQSQLNNSPQSSQGGLTVEPGATGICDDNWLENNTLVDCSGGIYIAGGNANHVTGNRVVQDGFLPDGVTLIGHGYEGVYIGGTNTICSGNVIGYVNSSGVRNDGRFPGVVNAPPYYTPLADPIDAAKEANELTLWQAKLASNNITLGA